MRQFHPRSLVWCVMAFGVILIQRILPPDVWDQVYYQGIFQALRQAYDFSFGWSPVPMLCVVVAVLLLRTAGWIRAWKKKSFGYQVSRALGGVGLLIVLFYILWGFNYKQVALQDRLGLDMNDIEEADLEAEFIRATRILHEEARTLPGNLSDDKSITRSPVDDHLLRPDVESALAALGVPHKGRVRVRQLWPPGFLLRWNTAGIYIPQTGEGHIDRGLLSVQKPFTIAHEMAHGYGVTDEGDCNFIAWLACSRSQDPWVRYGGALTYWRYVAAEMPVDSVSGAITKLPPIVSRSLALVRANDKKYPDLMPRLRNAIYASYLEHHGVKGGLRSYNQVVRMVHAYLKSSDDLKRSE